MKYTTKALATLSIILASFTSVNAQTTVCLGTDAVVCQGSPVTIEDCNPGTTAGLLLPNPTFVSLSDDSYSGVVPIGFTFNFYGNNKTQCVIGSNGVVTFDLTEANGYCPWALGGVGALPSTVFDDAMDACMPAYHDMNPSVFASPQGEIMYQTLGVAPNRQFVVLYKDIMAFGGGGECSYMGMILNETSNTIEYHLGFKPIAGGWNNGLAIQATENQGGTIAHATPGRNNSTWSAISDARLYTPTAPNNTMAYSITTIPYLSILSPNSTYAWQNTLGQTFPYNSGTLVVNPTLPGTTGYFLTLSAVSCSNGVGGGGDTTFITGVSSSVSASMTDDICSSGIGTVTATPTGGMAPYTFNWPGLGNQTTPTVTGVFAGNYTVQMWDAMGCMSSANILVGDTPAAFQGSMTVVSCPGGNDGTAFAEMIPMLGNITYQWDDPLMQTTQTAVGLTAGQYNCTITSDIGCLGVVTIDVLEIPGMIANIANQTDVTCNNGSDGMIELNVIQGTPPYTYSWDNSVSTTNIASDLMVGPHSIDITDANGCMINIQGVLGEPTPLSITFVTANTQICPEDDILLEVTGTGGSTLHTFTWSENGTVIGTGDQITVDPSLTNTTYCVVMSEACGSPTDEECTLIYFPTPIVPNAIPDEVEKCVPGYYEFTNTSTNGGEIATTYWDFGSLKLSMLEAGNDSISMWFDEVGTYTLNMTITSVYGCVYEDSVSSIIEVKPTPTADFFFSTNPATIFETSVFMQDKSSFDVVAWDWYSPGSLPMTSSSESPSFQFPEGVVGEYPITLAVVTERGCVDTVTYIFHVIPDVLFFAPNTFTPDGDEFNQNWKPQISGIDIYDYDMFIFNRWGELIWESHDPSVGWDGTYEGKPVQNGTYAWRARVTNLYDDGKEEFSGSINLIR
ncbi:MAG: gliding motility-associated-like protein [Crocinitomicaceae bacterium]|jgi:gliding motility-associated-like protein